MSVLASLLLFVLLAVVVNRLWLAFVAWVIRRAEREPSAAEALRQFKQGELRRAQQSRERTAGTRRALDKAIEEAKSTWGIR